LVLVFLVASLFGLVLIPLVHNRAVRLTHATAGGGHSVVDGGNSG
jgi:hypothetical protein